MRQERITQKQRLHELLDINNPNEGILMFCKKSQKSYDMPDFSKRLLISIPRLNVHLYRKHPNKPVLGFANVHHNECSFFAKYHLLFSENTIQKESLDLIFMILEYLLICFKIFWI